MIYSQDLLTLAWNLDNDTFQTLRQHINTRLAHNRTILDLEDIMSEFKECILSHSGERHHLPSLQKARRVLSQDASQVRLYLGGRFNITRKLLKTKISRDKNPLHPAITPFITPIESIHYPKYYFANGIPKHDIDHPARDEIGCS